MFRYALPYKNTSPIMLSSLVKEHSQRQAVRREHQETLRQNANKASADLTQALVDHLVIFEYPIL